MGVKTVFNRFFGGDDDDEEDSSLPVPHDGADRDSEQTEYVEESTTRPLYDIVEQQSIRVGGKEVLTETVDGEVVAGPFVREMFESAVHDDQPPLWIGYTEDPQTGFREAPLKFSSLFRHIWIAGTTGYGKSTLERNQMVQWAYAGYGFMFCEPKGVDSRELLRMLPEHRLKDVVWIEPGSTSHEKTVGMNFLELPECETLEERENEIESRVENLKAVFDTSDYWGINMEAITESMARAMMKSEKQFSIIDMYFILLNAERRKDFAEDVEDPYISEFCKEIAKMEDEDVRPLLKRIKSWVENGVIRRIIAHRTSTIDFDDIIENDRIVIVRTPVENTDIKKMVTLGVMRNLWSAVQRRSYQQDTTPDPYFVVCDEFDEIASENLDIESMLARARSMRLSVTLASQYPSQLDEDTLKAMQNNCDNLLTFSVNDSDDADLLMKRFRDYTAEDLITTDQFKIWTKIPLAGGRYSEPVLLRTFPAYPPLRSSDEIDDIIEASLQRYGTDPPTDTEILRNLIYRDYDGDTAPESLALDRVMAESIRAVQLRRGEHEQNGWVPVEVVDDEVLSRLENASDSELETSIDELTEVRRESPLVEVDLSVENDAVVVRLSEDGQDISAPETGNVSAAGGSEHDELLFDIEESLTGLGFAVELVEQDGSERPDGIATHPDLDSEFAIEAETTTPTKPAKVLQNLKRAQSRDQVPLFVVRPDEEKRTAEAARIGDILETPVRELADGTERFYTMDERLTFGGGANTRGGVTTVRPRTDGSDRTFWNRTGSKYELTNGNRVFARFDAEGPISKDDLPAHFSYDPETAQYTVYSQGQNHTYETKTAFEEDWVVVKRPFIPSRELPNPAFEPDDYHILVLPSDEPPLWYEDGDTIPVAADLSALDERSTGGQGQDSHAEPDEDMTTTTPAEGPDETEASETSLELDPDDDGVAVFVDRHITVDPDASVPKSDLFEAYSSWIDEYEISGTNKVWFARKLSDHVPVEPGRQRVDGERVTVYEGIDLSEEMKSASSSDNVSE
ncbi:type IV secretory system conjugative DNA transfer family protein [Haloarchaeobius litoreus]|uniref:TraM recognition domain-containing protein n=1 Tax=Haloarchaeobius litoreus TaxID=755306 RepID=A0ABD6DNV6_9EURY|nr:TraM recognition domain-containing protein [Haloarchaeobius litoreus]